MCAENILYSDIPYLTEISSAISLLPISQSADVTLDQDGLALWNHHSSILNRQSSLELGWSFLIFRRLSAGIWRWTPKGSHLSDDFKSSCTKSLKLIFVLPKIAPFNLDSHCMCTGIILYIIQCDNYQVTTTTLNIQTCTLLSTLAL